jgi:hypothetical protein
MSGNDLAKALPIYLRKSFILSRMEVDNHVCVAAEPRRAMRGPDLSAAVDEMRRRLDCDVMLCLPTVDAALRRALVNSRTPFVVPDKQVYLPFMCMIFTERGLASVEKKTESPLSPAAQLLLLFHLEHESLDGCSLKEVASILGYSAKTVTVMMPELLERDICRLENDGREKRLCFADVKSELWHRAKQYLDSPVRRVAYVDALPDWPELRFAFDSAMAHYSFIAEPRQTTVAVSAKSPLLKELALHPSEGRFRVELWKYDPARLSDTAFVDPLSLILSYKDTDDERIAKEIEVLENKIV